MGRAHPGGTGAGPGKWGTQAEAQWLALAGQGWDGGAQLPRRAVLVHPLTLFLLAGTLLMGTVGLHGGEEVHRNLGTHWGL